MADSPVNFMMYGHTADYLQSQQLKNKLLKQKLGLMVSQLTAQKEQNLKYLKQIDNQEETIASLQEQLRKQVKIQDKKHSSPITSLNTSKQFVSNIRSSSTATLDLKYRANSRSTQLPNKKSYLDANNKSIESSFESQMLQKKLKMDYKNVKRITSYGNLYNKKSFSVNKLK